MGIVLDIHVHTQLHSQCSRIEPEHLLRQAVRAGLDGLVITEHHYQWFPEELQALAEASDEPGFVLLAGFEYTTTGGDILVYGLDAAQVAHFKPLMGPNEALAVFRAEGAACVAAHPTRAGMGFDTEILNLPFDAIEVQSVNLQSNEQHLAAKLARDLAIPPIAASDAHRLADVGAYSTEFELSVPSMAHLKQALQQGRFRIAAGCGTRVRRNG